jgi:flagellar biosynthesis regulator FlbT
VGLGICILPVFILQCNQITTNMTTETAEKRINQILQKMTSLHKDAVLLAKLMSAKKEIKKGHYFTSKQIENLYKK